MNDPIFTTMGMPNLMRIKFQRSGGIFVSTDVLSAGRTSRMRNTWSTFSRHLLKRLGANRANWVIKSQWFSAFTM